MGLFLTLSKQWISRFIFLALFLNISSSVACRTDLDCVTSGDYTGYEWHCEQKLNQSSSSGRNDSSSCVTCRSNEYWDIYAFKCKYKSFNSTTDFVLGIIIISIVAIAVLYSAIKWLYVCCKCYSVTVESQNNMAQIMNDAVGVGFGPGPPGDGIMGSGPAGQGNRSISTDTVSTVMERESASWSSSIYSIGAGTSTGAGTEPYPNSGTVNGEGPGPISYH